VLDRALEDSKDDRYQSARELRDALRASLRSAAPVVAQDLSVGQCPACGTGNEAGRKYCRGCGESLFAPCLSCGDSVAMWDEICGSCGAKQSPLVEKKRSELAARQAKAEGLLGDHEFDRAVAIAEELKKSEHPRLGKLTDWTFEFLERIESSKAEETQRAIASIEEAKRA
jgi:hypothetical protein